MSRASGNCGIARTKRKGGLEGYTKIFEEAMPKGFQILKKINPQIYETQ